MKRLHRFIISSFLGPFVLTFFIVIFLLLMQFLWKYIDDLAGKGLPIHVLIELLFYVSASLIPMALPLAVLLASLMTMGNLGENYELTAMKASGISLPRIMAPMVVLVVILSVSAFAFANYVVPEVNLKWKSLMYDIARQKPDLQVQEGVFSQIQEYSIRVGRKDYKTNKFYDIRIYDHTNGQAGTQVSVADSGYMIMSVDKKFMNITLLNGYNYTDMKQNPGREYTPSKETYPFRRDRFERQELLISLPGGLNRTDLSFFRQNYTMVSNDKLSYYADSLEKYNIIRCNSAINNIYFSQMFRFRPPKVSIPDTFKYQKMDSVWLKYHVGVKNTILTEALTYARETKMNISNASMNIEDLDRTIRKYKIEWWRKFSLAGACFIFFFIGAPLGAIIRKGGLGMPVVISVLFFVLYYIISISGEKFAKEGVLEPGLGMWISGLILLPLGIFLTYKATRESSMMNADSYLNIFKKIAAIFNKSKRSKPVIHS